MSKQDNTVSYSCHGPFAYGTGETVCVHGWNTPHFLSSHEAQETDRLTNCGLLPARQRIEKRDE
jgi:hypothetical protein